MHFCRDDLDELYAKFVAIHGKICSKEFYRLQRPYFVRDASWVSSLCPTCHTMRLLLEGFGSLVFDARKAENKCMCQWCAYHHKGTGSVPRSCSKLMGEVFCPKKPTQPGSGFVTPTYPNFDLCCLKQYLTAKQQIFVGKAMGDNADAVAGFSVCQQCCTTGYGGPEAGAVVGVGVGPGAGAETPKKYLKRYFSHF